MALAVVAIGAFDSGADQQGVCVEKSSNTRVDDDQCDDNGTSGGAHGWYYIPNGRNAPAVGETTSGQGSFTQPSGSSFSKGGVSASGGEVTRGGFLSGKGSFGG